MARIDNFTNFATDVADSIREMTGTTEQIPASEFDTRIKGIKTAEDLEEELTTYNTELSEQEVGVDDIVTALVGKVAGATGTKPNIFIQEEEPESKEGIWLQTTALDYQDVATVTNIVEAGTWYKNGEFGKAPTTFSAMNTAAVGDNIYLLGAFNANKYYKYNTKDMTFTQLTSPSLRFISNVVVYETDIYFFGGYSSSNGYQSTSYKYNTLTDTYTNLGITAPALNGRGCARVGTDVYLFGGWNGSNHSTANKYDILTDTITEMAPVPTAGYNLGVAAVGTDIYINIGRVDGYKSYKFYKYDTLTDTYEQLNNAPCVASKFFTIGTKIYAFEYDNYTGVYVYDTTTQKWENTGWNQPRALSSALNIALVDNKFYIIGGGDSSVINVLALETSTFRNNTLALVNNDNISSFVATELFTVLNSTTRLLYKLNDVFYYSTETGLDDTIPTYYGDGAQWIKLKN